MLHHHRTTLSLALTLLTTLTLLLHPTYGAASCSLPSSSRIDCAPYISNVNSQSCQSMGCCWDASSSSSVGDETPFCFYPDNTGYTLSNVVEHSSSLTATLTTSNPPHWESPITNLTLVVSFLTPSRVRVTITDPSNERYTVPPSVLQDGGKGFPPSGPRRYEVKLVDGPPWGIVVTRVATGEELINTALPGFAYSDRFLSIGSSLPQGYVMYGLGEHVDPLALDSGYTTYSLFARDQGTPEGPMNLYGVHPFYVRIEEGGEGYAHGVFLLNSNGIDVKLSPQSMEWRTLGGILDLFVIVGTSPDDVVAEYNALVGRPYMPPLWSLGFHLCRWGYDSLEQLEKVNYAMRAAGLPQDAQWSDIDYMSNHLDFTYNTSTYAGLPDFVESLHADGQHYVPILDPGIAYQVPPGSYKAYDLGVEMDVFIKTSDGSGPDGAATGSVWPGPTVFPDFFAANGSAYWTTLLKEFHSVLSFDGLWIDMNEPANLIEDPNCPHDKPYQYHLGGQTDLSVKTICLSSITALGPMYNSHSLYGYSEILATRGALDAALPNKRSIIISRSTYPNAGMHGAHWLGDNESTWADLYLSIPGVLQMNMFGIPMVGPDTCGFIGTTTPELCTRWMQLSAFFPFYRNHNIEGAPNQAPYVFGSPYTGYIRSVMLSRYALIPYIYTGYHTSSTTGIGLARPMSFAFAAETSSDLSSPLSSIDKQFVLGQALLISPVLEQGATSVSAYFPSGSNTRFYLWWNGVEETSRGWVTLPAPLSTIPVHVMGGNIVPTQVPANNTVFQTGNAYGLTIALDADGSASGSLFVDDGITVGNVASGSYVEMEFEVSSTASGGKLSSVVVHAGWSGVKGWEFGSLRVLGIGQCSTVSVSAGVGVFEGGVLEVTGLGFGVGGGWDLVWGC